MRYLLGIDTGGTFTDFVLLKGAQLSTHKVLSTPAAPEQAILQGVRELELDKIFSEADNEAEIFIVHGSTVATNAVLEGKGVKTAFITNTGLGDLLSIARQARAELYNFQPEKTHSVLEREMCIEVDCRTDAKANVVIPLSDTEIARTVEKIKALKPRAVAINLLFSFLSPAHEQQLAQAFQHEFGDSIFISCSSQVLPEIKEYERGMATWLNAYVGPLVKGYLLRLQQALPKTQLSVMQSAGTTVPARQAGDEAVRMLLSGPAGGLAAAQYIKSRMDCAGLLTFDMGGTSTDVALIETELLLSNESCIAGYPVAVPMLDMHTIGAGGGSIAAVDAGGLLQVGPLSAGAQPGPVCYGNGGTQVTVTDANLVLGRLLEDAFLGGEMDLDKVAATAAVTSLSQQLDLSLQETAHGIIRVANEHMTQALRVMSVQRGIDPRELTLMSFGGAGGLHVCALAQNLQMTTAIVPMYAGVLSALGMLIADKGRHFSHTIHCVLDETSIALIEQTATELIATGKPLLIEEGVREADILTAVSLDCRYQGQSYTLNVKWTDLQSSLQAFHQLHQKRYGHNMQLAVEVVNVRLAVTAAASTVQLPTLTNTGIAEPYQWTTMPGISDDVPVYARTQLVDKQVLEGPALITETVATTYVAESWQAEIDAQGNIILSFMA